MLGAWIDSLTAEQKDRIIEGQGWRTEGWYDAAGNACLVGHAFGLRDETSYVMRQPLLAPSFANFRYRFMPDRFDALVDRFGMARIVRACKLRAAKPNVVVTAPSTQEIRTGG